MIDVAIIDTNLLLLLIVGSTKKKYISMHKRLEAVTLGNEKIHYTEDHFDLLGEIAGRFSEIVLIPHILAEVSNLSRQIGNPVRSEIQSTFKNLILNSYEMPISSISGVRRDEFDVLGLTDAVIVHICNMNENGINATLITVDRDLVNSVSSLGCSVIDYRDYL